MLNDWNTMENANLLEKNLLKKVGDLPIGTIICGLKQDNEIGLWVIYERCVKTVYLYNTKSYFDNTFIIKIDKVPLRGFETSFSRMSENPTTTAL